MSLDVSSKIPGSGEYLIGKDVGEHFSWMNNANEL
jgi:hypothetical protein